MLSENYAFRTVQLCRLNGKSDVFCFLDNARAAAGQLVPMTPTDKRNAKLTAAGEGLWGFQTNLIATATVLTVLLKSYGAGPRMIGAVAAIESGAILLPQLFGAYMFTSRKYYKRNVILWHYIFMLPFLLLMGLATLSAPRVSPHVYRWIMMIGLGCFSAGVGIVLATWMDWMAEIFHVSIRGTVLGAAMFTSAFAGTGARCWRVRLLHTSGSL